MSPNGLFPDTTNEFGYINCTAGSAKRISCGIGMKWEDETKSCQRKGEGLETSLQYFDISPRACQLWRNIWSRLIKQRTLSCTQNLPFNSCYRLIKLISLLPGGLPTLYYATLRLRNNAGKDVELIESEAKEPAHLLTKGEIRKIKLIGHETKHYKFEAIDNSTGEPLVLNNQVFANVILGDEPDRVMEVTISKPSEYENILLCCSQVPD